MGGAFRIMRAVAYRDVLLALKSGGGWLQGIVFYAVFVAFMAFAFGPDGNALRTAAAPTIWLATLFAIQLAASEMFVSDLDDGTLQTLGVEQPSLLAYVIGKLIGVLIIVGGPLIVAAPIVLVMFAYGGVNVAIILPSVALGAVALSLAAVIASAINGALQGGGRFTAILAAPLSIPVLIFGIDATNLAIESSQIWSVEMQFLTALTLFLTAIVPGFSVLALRLGLE
ncbi:MAG: heme exporter protein CcmB [Hyphomonadaceae bacterium]